jgi:tetratricopeptide (TPR) repeat protein
LQIDSRYAVAYVNLGDAIANQPEGHSTFELADPELTLSADDLAITEPQQRLAIQMFASALKIDPNLVDAYIRWGRLLARNNMLSAHEKFERAVAIRSNSAEALTALADFLFDVGDRKGAEHFYDRAAQAHPGFYWIRNNWGVALYNSGRYRSAVQQYRRAAEIDPRVALVFHNLGDGLFKISDFQGAVRSYQKAVDLDPNSEIAKEKVRDAQTAYLRQQQQIRTAQPIPIITP